MVHFKSYVKPTFFRYFFSSQHNSGTTPMSQCNVDFSNCSIIMYHFQKNIFIPLSKFRYICALPYFPYDWASDTNCWVVDCCGNFQIFSTFAWILLHLLQVLEVEAEAVDDADDEFVLRDWWWDYSHGNGINRFCR